MKEKTLRQEVKDLRDEVSELKEIVSQMAHALFDDEDCEPEEVNAYPPKQPDSVYGMMYR